MTQPIKIKIIIILAYIGMSFPMTVTEDEYKFLKKLKKLSNGMINFVED
jgi:hypothetical protein